nr:hypothetical protein MFMH1_72230 [Myxococcus sp. MH1]
MNRNLELIARLGRPDLIIPLLRQILDDPALIEEVASLSYRHVNHFDKIVLVDSAAQTGYRLTLHLWKPPYSDKEFHDELIHDHRFNFWSTILTGKLVTENLQRAAGGMTFRQYQYIPENRGASKFYTFMGEESLIKVTPSAKHAGQSYFLRYESIHRVVLPREEMACTLVLRGPRQRQFSNIYNTAYPSSDLQVVHPMFTPCEVRGRLEALIAAVARRPDYTEFGR